MPNRIFERRRLRVVVELQINCEVDHNTGNFEQPMAVVNLQAARKALNAPLAGLLSPLVGSFNIVSAEDIGESSP